MQIAPRKNILPASQKIGMIEHILQTENETLHVPVGPFVVCLLVVLLATSQLRFREGIIYPQLRIRHQKTGLGRNRFRRLVKCGVKCE